MIPSLLLELEGGHSLVLTDEGQSCCENRYMTCDDHVQDYVGASFNGYEFDSDVPGEDFGDDVHERAFFRVSTSRGAIVVTTHNEHNGYYGGFDPAVEYKGHL